jgi:hypothetical protein
MDDFAGSKRKGTHRAQRINYRALDNDIDKEVLPKERIIFAVSGILGRLSLKD